MASAAQILHPALARRIGPRTQLAETFQKLYGHRLTRAEADAVLHLGLNAGSSGYDGFRA
ncbi:hypothetical protein ABZ085_10610 [Streptomyces albidoflavus]|uniref:hypothetical protein n=1 Tax=Streptomyces TaxID=1883 RepID=UPI0020C5CD86|nr:hypothetical protein [Streptomyces sp. BV333]